MSFTQLRWYIRQQTRKIWVKVAIYALFGVLTAVAAYLLRDIIPDEMVRKISVDSVESILQILASSMLTVTTFSLSILTAAYATAGSNSSPRAVTLLVEDGFSHTVLATFVGAFIFSIVGIILLPTGVYGESGRLVLFLATLAVVLLVVAELLRWVSRLGDLGRVSDNLARVTEVAEKALKERLKTPFLGGNPLIGAAPDDTHPVLADQVGYVQHLDVKLLSEIAEEAKLDLYITAATGDLVDPATPLLHLRPMPADKDKQKALQKQLIAAFAVGQARDYDQDPGLGLIVLSEIAQRALSPGINDPGTAEAALARILQVMAQWTGPTETEVEYPRLWIAPLNAAQMLEQALAPIARDGAGNYQVQLVLQNMLLSLSRLAPEIFGKAADDLSELALTYSADEITIASHRAMLGGIASRRRELLRNG